jgi:hypothetical protein
MKIKGTTEAWESGQLGRDEQFVEVYEGDDFSIPARIEKAGTFGALGSVTTDAKLLHGIGNLTDQEYDRIRDRILDKADAIRVGGIK